MRKIRKHLEILKTVRRKRYSPLIYKIHKKHGISKKTLFYVKEYGPHANVSKTIIKESLKIVLFASILSSLGGLVLEHIKTIFISIMPLIILLPALNDMIGNYGIIISSRFSTMLHEGKIRKKWWSNQELRKLFIQIFIISIIIVFLSSSMAFIISSFSGYKFNIDMFYKILLIAILDVVLLISILILISTFAGLYFYKKEEDPNNFLIPITTSIADFGNLIILSILVILFF